MIRLGSLALRNNHSPLFFFTDKNKEVIAKISPANKNRYFTTVCSLKNNKPIMVNTIASGMSVKFKFVFVNFLPMF